MVDALRVLGFKIDVNPDAAEASNRIITVQGLGGRIPNTGTAEAPLEIFVGNAGTAARFLAAMVCLAMARCGCMAWIACMSGRRKSCFAHCAGWVTTLIRRTTSCQQCSTVADHAKRAAR